MPAGTGTKPPSDDDTLVEFIRAPFSLDRPAVQTVPFVFASPHSGHSYPQSFVSQSRLSLGALRRSEDAFVDDLFGSVLELGAPLIAANFPRAYLDANRAPGEIDAGMFEGALPFAIDTASPRVLAGLGVIPRIVREGAEIYRGKLSPDEARRRLGTLYRPYHAALGALLDETESRFGVAVIVDCHSMPSGAAQPDIVLGDRYGASAGAWLTDAVEHSLRAQGFSVARNSPYAGGYTTQLHGRPAQGRHALQIELNRALYLDEEAVCRTPSFADVKARLAESLRMVLTVEPALLTALRHAAE